MYIYIYSYVFQLFVYIYIYLIWLPLVCLSLQGALLCGAPVAALRSPFQVLDKISSLNQAQERAARPDLGAAGRGGGSEAAPWSAREAESDHGIVVLHSRSLTMAC